MLQKLEVKAFFFNVKRDYLPYYKNFTLHLDENATAAALLSKVQEQNENFSLPEGHLVFKINGYVVSGEQKMNEVVQELGTSLQIDPISAYRSMNGLMINDDDFMQSYRLLEPYCTKDDLNFYKTLYPLHYASETFNYKHDYIGDAVLVLAHRLITNGSAHQNEILKSVTDVQSGLLDCEYENNLFDPADYNNEIDTLKEMLEHDDSISLLDLVLSQFRTKSKEEITSEELEYHIHRPVKYIRNKNVAYYSGNDVINSTIDEEIAKGGGKYICFSKAAKRSGVTLLQSNRELALTKAGTILLDALDSGVETLVIENEQDYEMFTSNLKAIESEVNRDIPLGLVLAEDLVYANALVSA